MPPHLYGSKEAMSSFRFLIYTQLSFIVNLSRKLDRLPLEHGEGKSHPALQVKRIF